MQQLLKATEVAELLRLSERTVRQLIAGGKLPSVRFGRSIRVLRGALLNDLPRETASEMRAPLPLPPQSL